MFDRLDHVAIVVPDTEAALLIWRDKFGLPVLFSETINNGAVRLTHLDMGNTQLQLVQPLLSDHPLAIWLAEHGPGLHHFCFYQCIFLHQLLQCRLIFLVKRQCICLQLAKHGCIFYGCMFNDFCKAVAPFLLRQTF